MSKKTEKVFHQEPPKNNMRENEHQIIRDYIYNWKMNLENGLKKAKDHVLKKSSSAMKKEFEELKELSEFDTMLKLSIDDFERELSKVSFSNFYNHCNIAVYRQFYMFCVSFSRYLKLLARNVLAYIQAIASVQMILMLFS